MMSAKGGVNAIIPSSTVVMRQSLALLVLLATTLVVYGCAHAAGFQLVTSEEHADAMMVPDAADELLPKSVPGGPVIQVISPLVENGPIVSPVDIEVQFQPVGDARIDMSSLKIYYLMFIKKDVTARILEHAEIGPNSIRAIGAELPSGKHKFLLQISDSENRTASQKFVVKVGS